MLLLEQGIVGSILRSAGDRGIGAGRPRGSVVIADPVPQQQRRSRLARGRTVAAMASTVRPDLDASPAPRLFGDVLCAIDGSRGSAAAIRQALDLAGGTGRVEFLCVTDVRGVGANRVASVGSHRAELALAGAKALARDRGVRCETTLVHGPAPVDEILDRQSRHDLLVIGSHRGSRPAGIMTGSTATFLAHRTHGPLLIARELPTLEPFPRRMLVATEAVDAHDPVVDTATRLAVEHGSRLDVVHAGKAGTPLAELAADVFLRTGHEPIVTSEPGEPLALIVRTARACTADLLVLGHGGRAGPSAIGSVSERVVHGAPCSVLLLPS
jgi:nucleotide-binding universal stress UspA family protein